VTYRCTTSTHRTASTGDTEALWLTAVQHLHTGHTGQPVQVIPRLCDLPLYNIYTQDSQYRWYQGSVTYHCTTSTHRTANGKLIYDFLSVINTNLPPILHRLRDMVQFLLARGECLTFMLSLGVMPCQYHHKWSITKNVILWPTFPLQEVLMTCTFNHFYLIHPWSCRCQWNYSTVRAITQFKVIQGHRVWYQSKAHMQLHISD